MGSGSSSRVKKISTTHDQHTSPVRNLSLYQFHRVIKSTIVEIHSHFLNDRLQFDQKCRVLYIGDGEAFMLLVGMYITRGLITTLLLKPVEYRLVAPQRFSGLAESNLRVVATIFLYIVRQVTVIRGKSPMQIPGELQRFVYPDEEMRPVYGRLAKAIKYGETLLKEWGVEYIRRLRIAQQYERQYCKDK